MKIKSEVFEIIVKNIEKAIYFVHKVLKKIGNALITVCIFVQLHNIINSTL